MKNHGKFMALVTALLLASAISCFAAQIDSDLDKQLKLAEDITKETIVGPGSVQVQTGKDILMSFGATARIIPTSESNWDFGVSDSNAVKSAGGLMYIGIPLPGGGTNPGLVGNFFKTMVLKPVKCRTAISGPKRKYISMPCPKTGFGVFTQPWNLTNPSTHSALTQGGVRQVIPVASVLKDFI